jgi:hypothetical protein
LQIPTNFDVSPIFRPFYETELKRITSEGETDLNLWDYDIVIWRLQLRLEK